MPNRTTDGRVTINIPKWCRLTSSAALTVVCALAFSSNAKADDLATFATGGYSRGLCTMTMMHKIDTDRDGTVSHEELIAYESKAFDMKDVNSAHKGMIGKPEIMVATGGFAAAR